jgi:hypothetical protein
MFMNNEFKPSRETVNNRNGSVIAHGGTIVLLYPGTTAALSVQQGNTAESG